ncbi:hypothetical protein J6590_039886 [Homalodisca vitripennis]|nr:hypothetical protein J6590_039886 [Homalodisca vitripennis]
MENGTVVLADGTRRRMADLRVGDYVLSLDRGSGKMVFSEVILFLDRNPLDSRKFLRIKTRGGSSVLLTPSHLVLRLSESEGVATEHVFAAEVAVGDHLLVAVGGGVYVRDTVVAVQAQWVHHGGVYAPLTRTGTIVVDDILVSCYALINSQTIAHLAFAPYRLYFNLRESFERVWTVLTKPVSAWEASWRKSEEPPTGIHPYARFLYAFADYVVPNSVFFGGTHDTLS